MFFSGFHGFSAGPDSGFALGPERGGLDKHYAALELDRKATTADVRKAYRRLAVIHHPDKGGDADKFKEITEAYEVLCDPRKRGSDGGGGHPSDVFANLFQASGAQRRAKTRDVERDLHVTLEELYSGCTRKVAVERNVADPKTPQRSCKACGGTGIVTEVRQIGPMVQHVRTRCGACNGVGSSFSTTKSEETLEVYVPRGASDGDQIVVGGKADELPNSETGDAVFVVRQAPHAEFRRYGADLYVRRTISLAEALCGFRLAVTHLDGRRLLLKFGDVFSPRREPPSPVAGPEDSEWEGFRVPQPIVEYVYRPNADMFWRKWETLVQKVDPAIIGGVVIDVGDKHIDLSIASRIKQVENLVMSGLGV